LSSANNNSNFNNLTPKQKLELKKAEEARKRVEELNQHARKNFASN
jgi:hypothetical protein